ncbi:UDP-3-O-(3-hydroxymyristoyl)-glucosamine N-acyltransferase [Wigglesworthia glossinidia endosymbiont of Glossina morsitans morsitans (Yale colony)]|uniref:UDP-3-O-(3-hydroxymyristoyl)glucosamine N-acyltransferase n=1 Tax=Wigglesworthia glossinidia endosymbiont of Glossina morsitans morsitans (Yale colony) TaxID=1142511 RepID=H6Q4T2_WIGGL|nr:UDP-3-O-(3-hydroxymyristoyl)glucosamine N-acyltransferase [Wigglesworthia glossinidia]AFA41215.1 UDP-3-O-(3-hydroxymyristoyl)-glucosamine N-acyltransferase [Wigglesworthia glossinidia endosymbiont of Glossina morsitans morsitans (Yale colony)]
MLSISLSELSKKICAKLYGDDNVIIHGISSIENAKSGQVTFLSNSRFRNKLSLCKASAIIISKQDLPFCKQNALVAKNPYLAYAKTAQIMNTVPKQNYGISKNSIISKDVLYGKNISIGHNSVIESGVKLGDNVTIGSGCFIGQQSSIGSYTRLWDNTTIYYRTVIGKHCILHAGSIIGADGFGYVNDHGIWVKIPHLGRVVLGNNIEIGSLTTIDRGSLDDTYIGNGVIIDNQCQIAHNVNIGDHTAIAGGVIMAGSVSIGRNCMIGGASVINGHIKICDQVVITGMSMVMRSINSPGIYSSGIPAQPNKKWRQNTALIMHVNKIKKKIQKLKKQISEINLL